MVMHIKEKDHIHCRNVCNLLTKVDKMKVTYFRERFSTLVKKQPTHLQPEDYANFDFWRKSKKALQAKN